MSLELDLQIALASASLPARGYAAPETEQAYLRAETLLANRHDDARRFPVRYGLFVVRWNRADLQGAERVALEMLNDARQADDKTGLCVAHRSLAVAYNPMARYAAAEEQSLSALRYHDPAGHRDSASRFGHHIGVAALSQLMLAHAFQGKFEEAREVEQESIRLAEDLNHVHSQCYALQWAAFRYLIDREMDRAAAYAERVVRLADERAIVIWSALARCWHGASLIPDRTDAGLAILDAGLEARAKQRHRLFDPVVMCFRAEALLRRNQLPAAAAALGEATALASSSGEHWWDPEIRRLRALVMQTEGRDRAEIISELNEAVVVAEAQGSATFLRRAKDELNRFDVQRRPERVPS